MAVNAHDLVRRFETLRNKRSVWESHWQEVAERVLPRQAEFNTRRPAGEKRAEKIFDATAPLALDRFAAAMESLLTPRNQRWHKLRASDETLNEIDEVRAWFEQAENALFAARYSPRANFSGQCHETYVGLGAFGTGVLFVGTDPSAGLRYKSIHLGEIFPAEDHQGRIDTVYRKFELTARQAAQKWGAKRLSERVRKKLEKEPDETFEFLHCVFPREERDTARADAANMPYVSIYVDLDAKQIVSEGGFNTFPYPIGRYVTAPREVFGRSPAMLALPDIKMLNEMSKTTIEAAHQRVRPPLLLHDDGVAARFSTRPGALNYGMVTADGRQLAQPLQTNGDVGLGLEMMEQRRRTINDAFLVTLFQILVDRPAATATEVMERAQEKAALLGPTVGRQQSEFLGPLVEREIDFLSRAGALPPLPDALIEAAGAYEIEYDSPMTRAQRAEEGVGILRTAEIVAPYIAVQPDLADNFDGDEIARTAAEVTGVRKILRTRDAVDEMRQRRVQQQQAAAQAAAAVQGVESIDTLTQANKALADASPSSAPAGAR